MDTCERLLRIRLLEQIEKMPDMAEALGLSVIEKKNDRYRRKDKASPERK